MSVILKLCAALAVAMLATSTSHAFVGPRERATWASSLIDTRWIAEAEIDVAESALLSTLTVHDDFSLRRERALLMLLAKTKPDVAQRIARRILSGEFWPRTHDTDDEMHSVVAAQVLALGGDTSTLLRTDKKFITVDDAWALASVHDYRYVDVFLQELQHSAAPHFCYASVEAGPFLESAAARRDVTAETILHRLEESDALAAYCAASALESIAASLTDGERKRVTDRVATLLDGKAVWQAQLGTRLAVTWAPAARDEHVTSGLVRIAATTPEQWRWRAASVAAIRLGLLTEPLTSAWSLADRSGDWGEGECTGECSGRPLPLEFLRTQPFASGWPTYVQSMDADAWLDLLDAIATQPETVIDRAAKLNYLIGQPRLKQSFAMGILAIRALAQQGDAQKGVSGALLITASPLQTTSLQVSFPGLVPGKRALAAWRDALSVEQPWLRLAAQTNGARACGKPAKLAQSDLLAPGRLDAYLQASRDNIVHCPVIEGIRKP